MSVWVGFDVGKAAHWVSVVDDEGNQLFSREVEATEEDVEAALFEAGRFGEEHAFGVDIVGGPATLLEAALLARGERVFYLSGRAVNRARDAYAGGERKSDPRDARRIADQLRMRWRSLAEVRPRDEASVEIRTLVAHRRGLVQDQTRRVTRLRALLVEVFPGLEAVLDFDRKSVLLAVTKVATPAAARRLGEARLAHWLETRGVREAAQLARRVLDAAKGGYYARCERPPSKKNREDAALTERMAEVYRRSRETYGYPRVHAELRALGIDCGCRRVARLMREAGLRGCLRGRRRRTARRDRNAPPAFDLVRREFTAPTRDRPWLADITYLKTDEGFLHLAFLLDAHSRRVVGWSLADHLRTELVADALEMATWRRRPGAGLIHYTDREAQYTSLSFSKRSEEVGILPSMGRTGSALDNAMAESFVSTLKAELVGRHRLPTREAARVAIFDYIEVFHNRARRHSALGYESPADHEAATMEEVAVA